MENSIWYLSIFLGATLVAYISTWLMMKVAIRFGFVDEAASAPHRKQQSKAMPLLGGVAIFITITIFLLWLAPNLTQGYLLPKHLWGIILAAAVLMIGGIIDDRWSLTPYVQILFPLLAIAIVISSGIGIEYISNPFGDVWGLDQWRWDVFFINDIPYQFIIWADVFTILWLLGTMYTTKLLDGLDGLVPGITVIGGIIIFFLSHSQDVAQPETATLALVVAAAALGFLIWNFIPAKIYLGEGGSLLSGFLLGVLAILSGGKIATALLILGLPIIDLIWVIIRRSLIEKRSPFSGDALHLHFQLQKLGWSKRSVVLLFYAITIIFGASTLLFTGKAKIIVLIILAVASFIAIAWLYTLSRKQALADEKYSH